MKNKDKFFGDVDTPTVDVNVTEEVNEVSVEELPVVDVNVVEDSANMDLSHTALGMYLTDKGRFQVVELKYDPFASKAGSVTPIGEPAMDKMTAEEIFKMQVVRKGIFSN